MLLELRGDLTHLGLLVLDLFEGLLEGDRNTGVNLGGGCFGCLSADFSFSSSSCTCHALRLSEAHLCRGGSRSSNLSLVLIGQLEFVDHGKEFRVLGLEWCDIFAGHIDSSEALRLVLLDRSLLSLFLEVDEGCDFLVRLMPTLAEDLIDLVVGLFLEGSEGVQFLCGGHLLVVHEFFCEQIGLFLNFALLFALLLSHLALSIVDFLHLFHEFISFLVSFSAGAGLSDMCLGGNVLLSFLFPVLQFDLLALSQVTLHTQQDVVEGLVGEVLLKDLVDLSTGDLAILEAH